jgi:hypothetical protein
MSEHEYSVVGHSRSKVGMSIAFVAGLIAGALTTLAGILLTVAREAGYFSVPDILLWPITGTAVFGVLFLAFDKFGWRLWGLRSAVGIPHIAGRWSLEGASFDQNQKPQYRWSGEVEITQRYEKIFVCLRTDQSRSHSISAAMVPEGSQYRLIYSYRNQPKPGEPELQAHIGHCELLFERDLRSAEGSYFNGGGRFTHGRMKLLRI